MRNEPVEGEVTPRANARGVWATRVVAAMASTTPVSGCGATSGRSGSARRASVGAMRRATAASRSFVSWSCMPGANEATSSRPTSLRSVRQAKHETDP